MVVSLHVPHLMSKNKNRDEKVNTELKRKNDNWN
jgi:hypothetical protein